jgi:hypothetical protein
MAFRSALIFLLASSHASAVQAAHGGLKGRKVADQQAHGTQGRRLFRKAEKPVPKMVELPPMEERMDYNDQNFNIVMATDGGDFCFDFDKWCTGIALATMASRSAMSGQTGLNSSDFVNTFALCEVGRLTAQTTGSILVAEGSFDVTRVGQDVNGAGSVQEIDLAVNIQSASVALTSSNNQIEGEIMAEVDGFAYTDTSALCEKLAEEGSGGMMSEFLCAAGTSNSTIFGNSTATIFTNSSAASEAGTVGVIATHVHVKGEDIQEFSASVAGGVASFAFAEASSVAEAVVAAYLDAVADSYTEICQDFIMSTCVDECDLLAGMGLQMDCVGACSGDLCDEDFAVNGLNATSFADSFASSYTESFSRVAYQFVVDAVFQRVEGDNNDVMSFTLGTNSSGPNTLVERTSISQTCISGVVPQ